MIKPLHALLNLLYPPIACVACRDEEPLNENGLCTPCAAALLSEKPPRLTTLEGITAARAALSYEEDGVSGQLVKALKYDGLRGVADVLGEWMHPLIEPAWEIAALIPVPLHIRRQRERGFNQAQLIAGAISRRTGIPVTTVLTRVRYTKTQTKLNALERENNMKDAFGCAPCAGNLLLIDDVLTTGSTLSACAQALRTAGADKIYALTAAATHRT